MALQEQFQSKRASVASSPASSAGDDEGLQIAHFLFSGLKRTGAKVIYPGQLAYLQLPP